MNLICAKSYDKRVINDLWLRIQIVELMSSIPR